MPGYGNKREIYRWRNHMARVPHPTQVALEGARAHGLYDPQFEHESCGVGFLVHLQGKHSHEIVRNAHTMLKNLNHRGACGCEPSTGDGAGVLVQIPHDFLVKACRKLKITLPPR